MLLMHVIALLWEAERRDVNNKRKAAVGQEEHKNEERNRKRGETLIHFPLRDFFHYYCTAGSLWSWLVVSRDWPNFGVMYICSNTNIICILFIYFYITKWRVGSNYRGASTRSSNRFKNPKSLKQPSCNSSTQVRCRFLFFSKQQTFVMNNLGP